MRLRREEREGLTEVVVLDVLKVGRVGSESRLVVIEVLHPVVEVGEIAPNGSNVALEVEFVHAVE